MKINLLFSLLILFSTVLNAQYPDVAGCPYGNYVFLDNYIPGEQGFEIYRSEDEKNNFQFIGEVTAPSELEQLRERIFSYQSLFSDLGAYTEEDIIELWNYISSNTSIDTLIPLNFPVMHLATGTAFLDQTAEKGKKYRYRINGNSPTYRGGIKTTEAVNYPPMVELPLPEINNSATDHNAIVLEWRVSQAPELYSFRVYRRQNMAGSFKKIETERGFYNQNDTLFLVINDRSVLPKMVYEYYVIPLDRLENPGLPSDKFTVTSFLQSDVPVITRFDALEDTFAHQIRLKWSFKNPESVRSISVYRSNNYDSSYVKIAELPSTDTIYTDHVIQAMENYYYYLLLHGLMDKGYPSAKVGGHAINENVPEPPDKFVAEPVGGGVKLYWEHADPEVRGYYIYRDQGRNRELSQVSGFISAKGELMSFTDTTEGLSGNLTYRYAVKAVNDGYLLSELSKISAARPDIPTLIVPPSNLRGGVVNGNVLLVWDNMYKTNEFLLAYKVYRRLKGESRFRETGKDFLPFNQNTFTDSLFKGGPGIYEYAVSSIDESGRESLLSSPVEVEVKDPDDLVFAPAGVRASRGTDGIDIIWAADELTRNRYNIYRYRPGEEPQKIAGIPAGTFNYTDTDSVKGTLYFYYLTAIAPDGKESEPSESVGLRY